MENRNAIYKSVEELESELAALRFQLAEANEMLGAIRSGQIDALVVQNDDGHQLYTLKTADQTYRVFIEKMNEGAVTLNRQGVIVYSNSTFANMVSLPLTKVIGLPFRNLVNDKLKNKFDTLFTECWESDCKEEILLTAGTHDKPVQLSLNTLEMDEGIFLSIIITDLTAQKATQQQLENNYIQLEEINRALESSNHDLLQFASVASHDLQEPLRKIQVFSNLLIEKQSGLNPESRKYLEKIIESSGRMKNLIVDILNYSRLSVNNIMYEPTDLNMVINELWEDFELIVKEKNAVLISDELPVTEVNRGQIRQVFQNILSNALKFTKDNREPVITVKGKRISGRSFTSEQKADGPFVLIKVGDNGIGFNQKYLSNIFALFERLNSKDKFEGTGIGLAIAKKVVEKHNGLITAVSEEGKGSEFCIILPIKQTV